MKKGMP